MKLKRVEIKIDKININIKLQTECLKDEKSQSRIGSFLSPNTQPPIV